MEKWKYIEGSNRTYQVSSYGRVRSLDRKVRQISKGGNEYVRTMKGRVLSPGVNDRGYRVTILSVEGKQFTKSVHRLVAEAFLGRGGEYRAVNHIDGNKENNNVENLEWCSYKENTRHAFDTDLAPTGLFSRLKSNDKDIQRATELLSNSDLSQHDIAAITGISQSQISRLSKEVTL